jgi:hypothetical protein
MHGDLGAARGRAFLLTNQSQEQEALHEYEVKWKHTIHLVLSNIIQLYSINVIFSVLV